MAPFQFVSDQMNIMKQTLQQIEVVITRESEFKFDFLKNILFRHNLRIKHRHFLCPSNLK